MNLTQETFVSLLSPSRFRRMKAFKRRLFTDS